VYFLVRENTEGTFAPASLGGGGKEGFLEGSQRREGGCLQNKGQHKPDKKQDLTHDKNWEEEGGK